VRSHGVKVAVIMASGFVKPAPREEDQDAMLARARAAGMRIVGPNSQAWRTSALARSPLLHHIQRSSEYCRTRSHHQPERRAVATDLQPAA